MGDVTHHLTISIFVRITAFLVWDTKRDSGINGWEGDGVREGRAEGTINIKVGEKPPLTTFSPQECGRSTRARSSKRQGRASRKRQGRAGQKCRTGQVQNAGQGRSKNGRSRSKMRVQVQNAGPGPKCRSRSMQVQVNAGLVHAGSVQGRSFQGRSIQGKSVEGR